jgi:2-keto-4-pentenoate hydratase/2-oxohepta-3-ene-1,7-dioic acid hydratase in catechol pathway
MTAWSRASIYTGTPSGVGPFAPGDLIRVGYPELDTLEVTVL